MYRAILSIATLITVSVASQLAAAQATPTALDGSIIPTQPSDAQQAARTVERVIVTGQRRLPSLIREGAELTEDFYMRLNVVIDDDDFRIECSSEFPTGSNISRRVCRTRYQERLLNRQSSSILQNINPDEQGRLDITNFNGSMEEIGAEMAAMSRAFETAVLDAVNTDQELNDQVIRLMALKSAIENYETPRERRRRERQESEAD